MTCVRKFPLKIFEEATTYGNDYKDPKQAKGKVYRGPFDHPYVDDAPKTAPYEPKDIQTMRQWHCMLPFDALWVPKPITRTHPQQKINLSFKVEDTNKEEVIKTRPRVYMLPQVSMDDIKDPEMRKLIVKNMYISDWKKITGEIEHKCTKREIPDTTLQDPTTQTMRYKYDLYKNWPPELKKKCEEWDEKYPKNVVNQTEIYWKNFKHKIETTPAGQDPLNKFVPDETREKIRDLIRKDELRLAYDFPKQFYTGYKPRYDIGPLRKSDIVKNPYESMKKK